MTHHKAVGGAEVRELLLLGIPGILPARILFPWTTSSWENTRTNFSLYA